MNETRHWKFHHKLFFTWIQAYLSNCGHIFMAFKDNVDSGMINQPIQHLCTDDVLKAGPLLFIRHGAEHLPREFQQIMLIFAEAIIPNSEVFHGEYFENSIQLLKIKYARFFLQE